jgi:hypothetical protein
VPITYLPSSAWQLKSWDRFILPKPFSTITIRYGEPIMVAANADIEQYAIMLENSIDRLG